MASVLFDSINSARFTKAVKAPCVIASTGNLDLAGFQTINGTTFTSTHDNLRILAKDQTEATLNGLYDMQSGDWTRTKDFDSNRDLSSGTWVYVHSGTVGSGGYRLTTDDPITIDTTELEFAQEISLIGAGIEVVFDAGNAALSAGMQVDLEVPFAGVITQATLLADQSGALVIDIWNDSFGNFPPTAADSITASAKPTLSAAAKSVDTTLTGWDTTLALGDILRFNLDSVDSVITRATLSLRISRSQ